jgi:rhamnulokinase
MEEITGRTYSRLHIVGGGCQDGYLNELTAKSTGKAVYAGPIEATALGNLLVQMLANGEFASLEEGRTAIANSFDIKPV